MNLTTLRHFKDLVPNFGSNVQISAIQTHIDDAQVDYLLPKVGKSLVTALETAMSDYAQIAIYNPNITYQSGSKVRLDQYVYLASSSPGTPPGNNWTRLAIYDLLADWVIPFVTYQAAARMFKIHGINLDQFGIHTNTGQEFGAVSSKDRAMLAGEMERKASKFMIEIRDFLRLANWTIDGVVYQDPTRTNPTARPDFGISSPSKRWQLP